MRFGLTIAAVIAVAVATGCGNAQPRNLQPLIAVYGCYTMLTAPVNPYRPLTGKCTNCIDGKVGDGRVFVDCPVCGGDGIIDESEQVIEHPASTVPVESLPVAESPKAVQRSVICRDGKCTIR